MSFALKNIYACNPQTVRGQATHLGGDKKNGKNVLYCCGSAVIIRDLDNPLNCDVYLEHGCQTTVARYSPSGYYIASADSNGNLRIWDTVNKEHVLKIELRPLSGPITDLSWSDDSKRIAVCGEGKDAFAAVFIFDSGATVGDVTGHSKNINSIDFKQTRPYRLATGSEDNLVNFYAGPPFKFEKSLKHHTRFVNCVRFSPDGNKLVSVSSDGTGCIMDGKTADKLLDLSKTNAHAGAIYSVSWSPDSTKLLTGSADKTAKVWDANTGEVLQTFTFANDVDHIVVGTLWQGKHMITLSLNGDITYLEQDNTDRKVVRGHTKFITALAVNQETNMMYSGSYDGSVLQWKVETGEVVPLEGTKHTNQVTDIELGQGKMVTCAMDDTVAITDLSASTWGTPIKLDTTPKGCAVCQEAGKVVVVTRNAIVVMSNGNKTAEYKVSYEPECVAVSHDDKHIAVGGNDNNIHIYDFTGAEVQTLARHRGVVSCIKYSADGKYLASACKSRDIFIWDAAGKYEPIVGEGWCFHTARINCISWSPDSKHLCSGGLDGNAFIWNPANPKERIQIKNANMGGVNGVAWCGDDVVMCAGQECNIRSFSLKF